MDNRPVKRRRLETENHHSDSIQINENPTPSTVDKKGKLKTRLFSTLFKHNSKTYLGTNVQLILKTISFHAASKTDPSLWSMQVW